MDKLETMRNIKALILAIGVSLLVSGCTNAQYKNINFNALPEVPVKPTETNRALVYLYSDSGDMPLRIDEIEYGTLEANSYTHLYLTPGEHSIVYYDWLLPKSKLAEVVQEFQEEKVYHLKRKVLERRTEGGALLQGLAAGIGLTDKPMAIFGEISASEASFLRKKLNYQEVNKSE